MGKFIIQHLTNVIKDAVASCLFYVKGAWQPLNIMPTMREFGYLICSAQLTSSPFQRFIPL